MTAKVLIVDDNPSIRYLLKASLSSFGFHTALAENGQVALEQLDREKPDLVFLDLMMPVLDGWGVLDRLQGRTDLPPIVVISALDSQEDKERAMGLGVTAYVSKPADLGGLVDLVRSLTGETAPEPGGEEPRLGTLDDDPAAVGAGDAGSVPARKRRDVIRRSWRRRRELGT